MASAPSSRFLSEEPIPQRDLNVLPPPARRAASSAAATVRKDPAGRFSSAGPVQTDGSPLSSVMHCLISVPLFKSLSAAEFTEVISAAREQNFLPREALFREGDAVRFVFVVATGRIKITQLSRTGKQVILRVEGRGAVAGGLGLSPIDSHTVTAQAMEACQVFTWCVPAFEALARRFPALQHNAKNILAQRLRTLEERFCDVITKSVSQRLARVLIRLAEQSPPKEPERIGLSREELAQMTGTTLFTVSRVLRHWAEQDIVQVDRKAIVVEQLPRLIELAGDAA